MSAGQLSGNSDHTRILVADPIASSGVELLSGAGEVDVATGLSPDELIARIPTYDALVVRSETKVTAPVLEAATRLRVVGRAGVGVDNIDLEAATRHGVLVLNAPEGNTIAAAEHTVALILAMVRRIPAADRSLREGRWERSRFVGMELREKTLGVLGLGKIGFEVARIASQGLRMCVLAHDPLASQERAEQAGAELREFQPVLEEADVVTLHLPLNEHTRGLVGAAQLSRMKRGSWLVNASRGGIVDERALAEAIASGHLAGAGLDVFEKEPPPSDGPLFSLPQVVLTPHLGASTREAQVNVAADVADQIVDYLAGGSPRYAVNAPALLPEELAQLGPYVGLARRLGSLAAQLSGAKVSRVVCTYSGELADHDPGALTAEVLCGLFAHFTDTRVNAINAKSVARSLGVEVDERRTSRAQDHADDLLVEVAGSERLAVAGRQFGGEARLTRINDLRIDVKPAGMYLVCRQQDRPGILATVAGSLAEHDVNIGSVALGRDRPRGRAVMLIEIDEPVSGEVLASIKEAAKLDYLRVVTL
ncbi:MAG TPA: phosphoglycerate dehydrogenase [Candidatus Sulfotelmatobacter sp.]|nr:phosphoglycerate dehydrogenase [Candidatus Sulfotelmatobacter sp.]